MPTVSPSDVLAIIPARGGSKGVPRKNIRPLLGKPLIVWTIEAARAAPSIGRVIVSTDDAEIAEIARKGGADVPFMRPADLAQDATPDLPVLKHVLEQLRASESKAYKFVVWLRPTAPLRTPHDIESAVAIANETGADSVRSVVAVKHHPYWTKTISNGLLQPFVPGHDERHHPQRQTLPPAHALNGAVDVINVKTLAAWNSMWGEKIAAYVMSPERSIDIDTEADFTIAEALLRARG